MKKIKRNACESCYKSRVRCIYEELGSEKCIRCTKQNKECVARLVLRGRLAKKTTSQGEKEGAGHAYESTSIFHGDEHLSLNHNAAIALVKTYKKLGHTAPPIGVEAMMKSLYMLSVREKSMALLHSSTSLAVTAGLSANLVELSMPDTSCPIKPEHFKLYEDEVRRRWLDCQEFFPCFVTCIAKGVRYALASPSYEYFFHTMPEMLTKLGDAPHFKLWREWVKDPVRCKKFAGDVIKNFLDAKESVDCFGFKRLEWTTIDDERVKIVDRYGGEYTGNIFQDGFLVERGYLLHTMLAFRNLKPVNAIAIRNMNDFMSPRSANFGPVAPTSTTQYANKQDLAFPTVAPPQSAEFYQFSSTTNPLLAHATSSPGASSDSAESTFDQQEYDLQNDNIWQGLDDAIDVLGGIDMMNQEGWHS